PPTRSTLFPYTTLFRSRLELALRRRSSHGRGNASADADRHRHLRQTLAQPEWRAMETGRAVEVRLQRHQSNRLDSICREATCQRSEEHTSELQSRFDLV